jgi:TM2 domain-containing membrane protein YozV
MFLEILSYNELRQWSEAKKVFANYSKNAKVTDSLYAFEKKPRLRSITKAHTLSMIIPGMGQWYAGYPSKGLVSLGIQAGSLAFGVYSAWHGFYFSGFFTGAGLFNTFYQGGGRYASALAERKNAELTQRYNFPIRRYVLEEERKKWR